ncbi:WD40-repeat-containing domain [Arabidopsis thaliana x Arabidopsis arenosa]|uniref:WD40-repeat-containing domain n=1 Tax=Arabidopsis thaliana x Arabidopsis arenosa TaxID=1240361 RepID=A0A8T2BF40_9BRAS|nr:WD40-repeat-containing domain [Arabidopsis thaliana x Arabidopsis arenosa]
MGTRGDEEDEDRFFDASEDSSDFGLHLWTNTPDSVSSRRRKFLQSMGFSFKKTATDDDEDLEPSHSDSNLVSQVVTLSSGVDSLVRNESTTSSGFDISSVSSSAEDTDDQTLFFGDFHNSPLSQRDDLINKGAKSWLKKLGVLTHVFESMDCESVRSPLHQVARVQTHKKHFKELSSMCIDQEFSAHDGSILAMKFSLDGKYIASAGEDGVVRVWSITEEERTDKYEVAEVDSGVYFGMNQHSQIEPLKINNEKSEKKTSFLRKSSDSTCVVLPPTIFSILEKPLHEFRGHIGEILDLSWSEKGYLLSSSVDETVRLWRVGCDECLRTFTHNNFVTCVAFNPVDDNYFISGSIDGKVRIWDVIRCRVVDYTDIRDIVTAVCYRPDAKGAVIGSMTGNCRFYHIFDNQLQMNQEINVHGKKKVTSKRISGLQFLPSDTDSYKVMVTSADSQIRIICGDDVICKLKASSLRTTSASFISDGKHIISTSEDSYINVWSYSQLPSKKPYSETPKSIRSYEGFLSHNASVAIPWLRQGSRDGLSECITDLDRKIPKVDCFSPMKGSTTWPEEKLEDVVMSNRGKLKLLRSAWQPHLWGLVIVTATWDGRIRVFHNYGLPVRV